MKCNVCQQNNFTSLHGRLFCVDCGSRAAERLQEFKSQHQNPAAAKIDSGHTLDLTQLANKVSSRSAATAAANTSTSIAIPAGNSLDLRQPKPEQQTANTEAAQPKTAAEPAAAQTAANPTTMQPQATYPLKPDSEVASASLETALNHIEEKPAKRSRLPKLRLPKFNSTPIMRLATVTAGMVLLFGYVTYLNYPNIAVRVAASQANIGASMPGYVPSGYRFSGPVAYDTGTLTLTFSSREGNIALTQSQTRWDSESLLDNLVRQETSKYSTYQENGLTIYIYDNRNAVWVNGGLLYKIEASKFINPDDIVKMASSL